jgi:hypothetical protein
MGYTPGYNEQDLYDQEAAYNAYQDYYNDYQDHYDYGGSSYNPYNDAGY